ncbi:MAG TPA: hypothetical protein VKR52_00315 [Terracidiphilus sp.]|nr:hypothetical protein [Terracidiphilus sp.]
MRRSGTIPVPVLAALALAALPFASAAQQPSATSPSLSSAISNQGAQSDSAAKPKDVNRHDQRQASQLFLEASKLYQEQRFEPAMQEYERAAALDPTNQNYELAAQVARSHLVSALIQSAAKDRLRGDPGAALAALRKADSLDPGNPQIAVHIDDLAMDAEPRSSSLYEKTASQMGETPILEPSQGRQSFHLKSDRRQLIQEVFRAFHLEATVDQSVQATPVRFDLEDATFQQAMDALSMVTDTFWVPLDAHRALVARDTQLNRNQFLRQDLETFYLSGLTPTELTDVTNMTKNVFNAPRAVVAPTAGTLTVRAPERTLNALNATLKNLLGGRSQVLLDVRLIQLAHNGERNTGAQLPQTITAFNVYAEEQSILNANQSLVQEIISSGLAAPGDTLAILGILLASGQVSNSIFSNGIALFGGGLTLSGISPSPATLNLNLNSSDSRELDQVQLRLGDGDDGTLRSGTKYPIMTASYSSLSNSNINIPGLTSAGSSSGLAGLLSGLQGSTPTIPQVQYQDLGLTLKANPKVMRNGDVALSLDLKIAALAGSSINGVPVLNNRAYTGVVTVKAGAGVVIASEVSKQESQALTGTPGLSEIPGLNNLTEKDVQNSYATLLIMITPHVIRGPQSTGSSPMFTVDKSTTR